MLINMQEYLEKHNLKDIEDIAQHIMELKRNTFPDLKLISSLYSYIFLAENEKTEDKIRVNFYKYVKDCPITEVKKFETIELAKKYFTESDWEEAFYYIYGTTDLIERENRESLNREQVIQEIKQGYLSTRHKSQTGESHGLSITSKCKNKDGCFCSGNCNNNQTFNESLNLKDFTTPTSEQKATGKKEEDGKLTYELDWEFIEQLANRMAKNKGKYKPYNWQEPIDVEKLKQSLLRHVVEIMKGNYEDDEREFGHIESVALNAMFINYQLKLNKS